MNKDVKDYVKEMIGKYQRKVNVAIEVEDVASAEIYQNVISDLRDLNKYVQIVKEANINE